MPTLLSYSVTKGQQGGHELGMGAPGFNDYSEWGSKHVSIGGKRLDSIEGIKRKFTELSMEDQLGILDDLINEANLMSQLLHQQSIA